MMTTPQASLIASMIAGTTGKIQPSPTSFAPKGPLGPLLSMIMASISGTYSAASLSPWHIEPFSWPSNGAQYGIAGNHFDIFQTRSQDFGGHHAENVVGTLADFVRARINGDVVASSATLIITVDCLI